MLRIYKRCQYYLSNTNVLPVLPPIYPNYLVHYSTAGGLLQHGDVGLELCSASQQHFLVLGGGGSALIMLTYPCAISLYRACAGNHCLPHLSIH